jgi:hypothetical protein
LTWGPVALLVVLAGADLAGERAAVLVFVFDDAAFDDAAPADAEAAGVADVPDPPETAGSVARPDWAGVVWNVRTPMRPASVPPSTIGVRFIARSFAT